MYKQKGFDSGNGGGKKGDKKKSPQGHNMAKSGTIAGQYLRFDGVTGAYDVNNGTFYDDPDQFIKIDKQGFVVDDDYRFDANNTITHRNDSTGSQIFAAQEKRAAEAAALKKNNK